MKRRILIAAVAVSSVAAIAALSCGATQRPDGGEGMLGSGDPAPDVSGVDQDGTPRSTSDAAGQYLVVYFYPKDGTPGCTAEACAFRDAWLRYERAGVMVYGVSADDQRSHAEFAQEHDIPFPLIADPDGVWTRAFGVSTFLGMTSRVTFVIGPDKTIAATHADVDPGVHATQLLGEIDVLRRNSPR